jgi:hypothetical protein
MVILLFKDDKSYVDLESSYAISRRVPGYPCTKFGVRISLKTQSLPTTAGITLDFWLVHFGRTPRQFNHVSPLESRTLLLLNFSSSPSVMLSTYWEATSCYLLTTAVMYSAFISSCLFTTQVLNNIPIVNLYSYGIQCVYLIILTIDFWKLKFQFLSVPTIPHHKTIRSVYTNIPSPSFWIQHLFCIRGPNPSTTDSYIWLSCAWNTCIFFGG